MPNLRALLFALLAIPLLAQAQQSPENGVLIVSRERLELGTLCDIGLYLSDHLSGRLMPGETVSFNLPPGQISLRIDLLASGHCKPGIEPLLQQSITLAAGEIRRYRLAQSTNGLYLIPVDNAP